MTGTNLMRRNPFRSSRLTYLGQVVRGLTLEIQCEVEVLQGPAGWVPTGQRHKVRVPISALLAPDVTDALDRIVRRQLRDAWAEPEEQPLF